MKVSVKKEDLVKNLSIVERMSGKNLSLAALNAILIEVKKNTLTLRATNLDVGIEVIIPVKGESDGIVAVPGSVLLQTALSARGNIDIELVHENVKVKSEGGETVIKAVPHEDFPTIPRISEGKTVTIDADTFIKGFRSVLHSASQSAIKPELSSIFLYTEGGKLYFVATDSFRLAEKAIPLKKADALESLLIPVRNVADIVHTLDIANEEVTLSYNKNQVAFVFGGVYMTSRLVDGTFPDYQAIIPKNFSTEVTLLKQDLMDALKKANIFANKFSQVYFSLDPKKQKFTIRAENPDVGETKEDVRATLSGDSLEISFNQKYVFDVFQSIHTDSISLSFSGLGKPVIIQGVSDTSFLYLVMPMNR